jgi:hypothetical protein
MSFEVEITLNGKRETLKTSLRAARAINGFFGNFVDAQERLNKVDQSAYVAIVAAGLDKKPGDVEEAVFAAGLDNLLAPLFTYVGALARGGRDPNAKTEDAPAGE